MAEIRRDPITGRWVILSMDRTARPNDFSHSGGGPCPFCAGNERETLTETMADPPGPAWQVRVVPNRYPALDPLRQPSLEPQVDGIFQRIAGEGIHEVIIESPQHLRAFTALSVADTHRVARTWRGRLAAAAADPRIAYALVFRNHGKMAGASREHVHSQMLASPSVPAGIAAAVDTARAHHGATGRCIWCDLIARETSGAAPRLIAQDAHTVTLAPFAPRFAYEAWILPRVHAHDFGTASDVSVTALADAFAGLLRRLERVMGDVPHNMGLQTAPRGVNPAAYHWRVEVYPRLHHLAGYEWGSGSAIVSVTPEDAAARLREATA